MELHPVCGTAPGLTRNRQAALGNGCRCVSLPPPVDLFCDAREARRAAQEQQLVDQRRDLARRAALLQRNQYGFLASPGASRRSTAKAAQSETIVPLTAALPAAAPIAVGEVSSTRVLNPKIWQDEHNACYAGRKVLLGPWLGAARKFAKARELGNVLEAHTYAVAALLAHTEVGKGCARVAYKTLAFEVGCCRETVRKVIRSLGDRRSACDRKCNGPRKRQAALAGRKLVPGAHAR